MLTVDQIRQNPCLIDTLNVLALDALDDELKNKYPRKVIRSSDGQTLRQIIKAQREVIKQRDTDTLFQQILAINSLEELESFLDESVLWKLYAGKTLIVDGNKNLRSHIVENHRRFYRLERDVKKLGIRVVGLAIMNLSLQIHPFMEELIHIHGRNHGNAIYDLPYIHSGWTSEKCLEEIKKSKQRRGKTYAPSKEHFYSRQQSGNILVKDSLFKRDYIRGESLSKVLLEFTKKLHIFVHVHYVTSNENSRLMKHQQDPNLTWQEAYDKEGIILVPVTDEAIRLNNPDSCLERQLWNRLFDRIKAGVLNQYFWDATTKILPL